MNVTFMLKTKPDHVLKDFFKDRERFADLINAAFYKGKQVISPDDLSLYDSDGSTYFDLGSFIKSVGKSRDVFMYYKGKPPMFIGLENQSTIDKTMPFRLMTYDVIGYNQQFNLYPKKKRSSFKPIPIMTFVLYHGEEKWKKPFWFKQMMKMPRLFYNLINNWYCIVIDIRDINVKYLRNKENYNVIKTVQEFYKWNKNPESINYTLTREEAIVVATMLKTDKLRIDIEESKEEEINMCSKIKEAFEEQKQLGIIEGERHGQALTIIGCYESILGNISANVNDLIMKSSKEKLDLLMKNIGQIQNEEEIISMLV